MPALVGTNDKNLHRLEDALRSKIVVRGDNILVEGPQEEEKPIRKLFKDLQSMAGMGSIDEAGIDTAMTLAGIKYNDISDEFDKEGGRVVFEKNGLVIKSRSRNQEEYIRAVETNELVFAVGPAGTGKTYLAVTLAVRAFLSEEVNRIVLVRPAVEAGENLGFLPGDLQEKVEPYFRPIYDALMEMIPPEKLRRYIDQSVIEIAPLAYMRGRTLSNAFVLLDEAQNTTGDQLKMFLTRLGTGSRAVVTGDLTQIDLADKKQSGLSEALKILRDIRGIGFITLDHTDVVRHALVRDIIQAYEVNNTGTKGK